MAQVNEEQSSEVRSADSNIVYVVPSEDSVGDELNLIDLWEILWGGRLQIVGISSLFAIVAIAYALLATEWYRSEVLLIPNEDNTAQTLGNRLGGLGGLAGLAGINVSGGDSTEALAVLRSRDFARSFIEDRNLLPVLLHEDWDKNTQQWQSTNPDDQPDVRDGVRFFEDNVRTVSRDARTQLVTLSITWTDAEQAADWAMDLVARLNQTMRERALKDAERNIAYLRTELESTDVATLRDAIGSLLEAELQKAMLARGNGEFAYRIVDPAQVPKLRDWPKRSLIVITATMLGGILGVLIVLIRHALARRRIEKESG